MSRLDPGRIEAAALCDIGRVRSSNQDACGEARAPDGGRLFVVADGMGGHAGGETASRLAVEAICAAVGRERGAPGEVLRAALEEANRAVHEAAQRERQLAGMGTTGVAMLFSPDASVHVANVGDSRAYRLRAGRLEQISADHSLVAELQRRGLLSEAEARVHPRRNEVLRSLGVESRVEVDLFALEVEAGDVFLLCSDGLSGPLHDPEIAELLRQPPERAARALVELANRRGGPDNVTVQIARIPELAESDPAAGSQGAPPSRGGWLVLAAAAALLSLLLWRLT